MIFLVFLAMIFFGIVDDFYLQGKLCNLKQKKWWEDNYPDDKYTNDYKCDYKCALIIHSFSWSFMVMLPQLFYIWYLPLSEGSADIMHVVIGLLVILNTVIHYIVDDGKANKLAINLFMDQFLHLYQILFSWILVNAILSEMI